jgi:hypothetical protein
MNLTGQADLLRYFRPGGQSEISPLASHRVVVLKQISLGGT